MPLWSAGSIGHRELPGSGIPATRACPSCGPLQTVLEMNALLFIPASKLALRACALEPTVGQPCDRQWTDGWQPGAGDSWGWVTHPRSVHCARQLMWLQLAK